jgi:hypothetical protein
MIGQESKTGFGLLSLFKYQKLVKAKKTVVLNDVLRTTNPRFVVPHSRFIRI